MTNGSYSANPVRFEPSMEQIEKNEAETDTGLNETMGKIREKTFADTGHAMRSSHAKTQGLLRGRLQVLDDLPPVLAQGLFARPATYEVAMRLSTLPGDILDDKVSTPRGMAIKVIGVKGARLPGSESGVTQDFIMVNNPAFFASSAKELLMNIKLLAATTDRAEGAKKALSAVNRGTERLIEMFGLQSPMLQAMGGQAITHPLGETFFSQAPILYGDYVAKVSLAPSSPGLTALTDAKVDLRDRPNGLREEVREYFAREGGAWELRVQLCTDLKAMPIEDPSVIWPEDKSPYIAVARITVEPQDSHSEASIAEIDDGMSFSPWHCLAAHRPLGSIMRARKLAYEQAAKFRASHNGCPIQEPRSSVLDPAA